MAGNTIQNVTVKFRDIETTEFLAGGNFSIFFGTLIGEYDVINADGASISNVFETDKSYELKINGLPDGYKKSDNIKIKIKNVEEEQIFEVINTKVNNNSNSNNDNILNIINPATYSSLLSVLIVSTTIFVITVLIKRKKKLSR